MSRRSFRRVLLAAMTATVLTSFAAASSARETDAERAADLVAQMTRDEKVSLAASGTNGLPRLGIPPLVLRDGPNGVGSGAANVTAFPNAEVVAASWDRSLAQRFGSAVGAEAAGKGINVFFAPTVNILRTPRWGRSAE